MLFRPMVDKSLFKVLAVKCLSQCGIEIGLIVVQGIKLNNSKNLCPFSNICTFVPAMWILC